MTACAQDGDDTVTSAEGEPDLEQALQENDWLLDWEQSTLASPGSEPVSLVFDEGGSAHGAGACNSYRAQVEFDGDDAVRFAGIATTLRACEEALMEAEQAYLDALAEVCSAALVEADRLVLTADDVELSFSASPLPPGATLCRRPGRATTKASRSPSRRRP